MTERHFLLKTYFTHLSSEAMLPWHFYNMFTLCLFLCIIDGLEGALERVTLVYILSSVIHSCFEKCISIFINIYLYKAEVRWYRLSLSVVRRTELEQVVYVSVYSIIIVKDLKCIR